MDIPLVDGWMLEYENGYSFSGWMDDCWNMKMDIPLVDGWMDG
jgi:hypothetical protein